MNRIIFLLFYLLLACPSFGQTLESKAKTFSVYESDNSSFMPPSASITDEEGVTWISTEMGLLRYDGLNVVKIEDVNYPKISSQRIRRLSKDTKTGYIYFNTYPDKTWFRIKNGRIEKVIPEGFSFYINTSKKKILHFNDARLKKILLPQNDTPVDVMLDFNKASMMEVLNIFKTDQYLYLHKFDELIVVDLQDYSVVVYPLPMGNLLFNFGNNIYFLKDKKFHLINGNTIVKKDVKTDFVLKQFAEKFEVTHPDNNRMMMTETEDYYIILDDKIYKVIQKGDSLKTVYITNSFSKDICDLNHYKTENIFLLSGFVSGFTKLIPQNFNQLVFKDPNLVNYSIVPIGQNIIYSATGWFYNLKTNEYKRDNYTLDRNKYFLLKNKKAVYAQVNNRILNITNPKDSLITDRKNHLGFYSGFTFGDEKMWVSQANQSNLLYSGNHEKIATDTFVTAKLQGKTITYLMPVGKELLIATMEGLYRYNPSIKKIQFYKQFGKKYIRRIIPISENSFWVCCYGDGLYLCKNDKFYKVNADHVDFSAIHTLEEDKQQNLWISSNNGLFTVNKATLITNTLQGKTTSLYKFSIKDGLLTNEFNGGSTHPSFKNEEGLIGFASMRGVLWFNPEEIKKTKFSGNIYIHSVLQDGKQIQPVNQTYTLGSNTGLVTMNLFYPYYNNRENLIVEYKSNDKNNWSKVIDDKIVFTRQKEGTQKVLVRITTKGFGNNSSVVKSFHFYFEPRYYETIWFLVLCILVLAVLLFTSFKIGLAINKKYRKKLEERIREKTAELEESNKMLFESREDISKSLKEKELLLKEIHHRVKNNLQLVISLLNIQGRKNNYQTIEEFLEKGQTRIMAMVLIHENLYQNDSIERLNVNKYLQSLVQKIVEAFEINSDNIVVHIEAENITMNLQTAIPFGLMINEFVTNSVKHAFPKDGKGEIKIVLSQKDKEEFELKMEDNGTGFKTEKPTKKSFGLELIKLLTNQLNGTIQMMTEGNTRFHITFKESMV
jgi:two-component sensor histidine kinase